MHVIFTLKARSYYFYK